MAEYKCRNCDHIWIGRKKTKPKECPKCKTRGWEGKKIKRTCQRCNKSFYTKNNVFAKYCKECREIAKEEWKKDYIKKYYARPKIKERKKKYMKKWEEKNREKRKKYWKNHYEKLEVKARKRKNMKHWRKTHKEHEKEYRRTEGKINSKKYNQTQKGRLMNNLARQRRLSWEKNIIHKFTREEWQKKLEKTKGICPKCKIYVGTNKLELDHLYPVSKASEDYKKTGIKRIYTIKDIQPLCRNCNREKWDKIKVKKARKEVRR